MMFLLYTISLYIHVHAYQYMHCADMCVLQSGRLEEDMWPYFFSSAPSHGCVKYLFGNLILGAPRDGCYEKDPEWIFHTPNIWGVKPKVSTCIHVYT